MPSPPSLAAPCGYGRATLEAAGLVTEAPVRLEADEFRGLEDLAASAHAPFSLDGKRLNVGCKDDDWRQRSIDAQREYMQRCRRLPKVRKVVLHLAPKRWFDAPDRLQQEGDYDRLIDALQGHADFAAGLGLDIVLENNRTYYPHQMPDAPTDSDGLSLNQYFGAQPEEWLQIVRDVDRPNCFGCLDTSHACASAHARPPSERERNMMAYLAEPERIGHVHWNGNDLFDPAGRDDQHLPIDAPGLPRRLHEAIARLNATKLLEHLFDADVLARELAFIAGL